VSREYGVTRPRPRTVFVSGPITAMKRGTGWNTNPWVWVVGFGRIEKKELKLLSMFFSWWCLPLDG
jgi:hypothetical protein